MTQTSFYSDNPNYATDYPAPDGAAPANGNTAAPSSFYQGGTQYATLAEADALTAEIDADLAAAQAAQAGANSSATNAASSATAAASSLSTLMASLSNYVLTTALTTTLAGYITNAGLATTLSAYAPLASPAFTGTPTAPTAAPGTNTTQLATTAFVLANGTSLGSTTPAMDGTGNAGSATVAARADHVHPTDTSRAPLASPALTGIPTAPTATVGTNTTQLATTAFVLANAGSTGAVVYNASQSLTAAQQVQARSNVYAAPFDALAYSGMQFNGSMEVSQEKGTSVTTASSAYIMDGWALLTSGPQALAASQVFSNLFAGFQTFLNVGVTTANASPGASDYCAVYHSIEGYRINRLYWGQGVSAQPITIGFWTAHHRPGVYGGSIRNSSANRSYAFNYTQTSADIPQFQTITIPGDLAGTWQTTNSTGLILTLSILCGTTFAGTAGAWAASNYVGATGQVNGVAATSDTFRVTGLIVLPGIEVPSAARPGLIMRPFDQELLTCKRYWEKSYDYGVAPGTASTALNDEAFFLQFSTGTITGFGFGIRFKATKRAAPTCVIYSPASGASGKFMDYGTANGDINATADHVGMNGFRAYNNGFTGESVCALAAHWTADARL